MVPNCYTHYLRPTYDECPLEIHPDEGKVETAGYVSTEIMVNRLIDAGERLSIAGQYEFPDGKVVPDDYQPFPQINNLDALYLQKVVAARLEEQEAAFKLAQAAVVVEVPEVAAPPNSPK